LVSYGEYSLSCPSSPLSAQQGRQGAFLPPAETPFKTNQVYLGTFVDDPDDLQHIEKVRSFCSDLHVARLEPKFAKIRSLNALFADDPLTLRYYRDAALQDWVDSICSQKKIDAIVVFSSAMAQYVESKARLPIIIDFVDVDSAKWTQYAPNHRWPMSWLYRREGEHLLAYEREIAARSTRSFFVTETEAALFTRLAPECAIRVEASATVWTQTISPRLTIVHRLTRPMKCPSYLREPWITCQILMLCAGLSPTYYQRYLNGGHDCVSTSLAAVRQLRFWPSPIKT
jgi:hypothetical protein